MNANDFQLLIRSVNGILKLCNTICPVDISKVSTLSISDYNKVIIKARSALGVQDRLVNVELYHIIGMGNLTASQMAAFLKKVKDVLATRNAVKYFSELQPISVGVFNNKSEYATSLLGGKKLIKKE